LSIRRSIIKPITFFFLTVFCFFFNYNLIAYSDSLSPDNMHIDLILLPQIEESDIELFDDDDFSKWYLALYLLNLKILNEFFNSNQIKLLNPSEFSNIFSRASPSITPIK